MIQISLIRPVQVASYSFGHYSTSSSVKVTAITVASILGRIAISPRRFMSLKVHRRNLAGRRGADLWDEQIAHTVKSIEKVTSTKKFRVSRLKKVLVNICKH